MSRSHLRLGVFQRLQPKRDPAPAMTRNTMSSSIDMALVFDVGVREKHIKHDRLQVLLVANADVAFQFAAEIK